VESGYERLPAQDTAFLAFETANTHMHLGGTAIFERGSLATGDGGVDIERIRGRIAARLHLIPRYRQRLRLDTPRAAAGLGGRRPLQPELPRAAHEPAAAGRRGAAEAAIARIMSQQLDRTRPLWEAWIVEGLEGGRFALVTKTHHCMADGVSAVDLITVLLSAFPDNAVETPAPWTPRPAPSTPTLVRDEALERLGTLLGVVRRMPTRSPDPRRARATRGRASRGHLADGDRRAPPPGDTPLNRPIGPHRRIAGSTWTSPT